MKISTSAVAAVLGVGVMRVAARLKSKDIAFAFADNGQSIEISGGDWDAISGLRPVAKQRQPSAMPIDKRDPQARRYLDRVQAPSAMTLGDVSEADLVLARAGGPRNSLARAKRYVAALSRSRGFDLITGN